MTRGQFAPPATGVLAAAVLSTLSSIGAASGADGTPGGARGITATHQPAVEVPDTLGPTSDADDDGLGTAPAVGLGAAALALIAGGLVLRRRSRD